MKIDQLCICVAMCLHCDSIVYSTNLCQLSYGIARVKQKPCQVQLLRRDAKCMPTIEWHGICYAHTQAIIMQARARIGWPSTPPPRGSLCWLSCL